LYYVCKGGGKETWAPRFTYTGFQYAEISGLKEKPDADSVQAVFVRSAIEKTGDFSCSHELLNQQYEASLLSMEGNVHSLPEDCPHREKCGWLGDAHATADLCLYNYDIFRFYAKYNRDIQDSLIKRYNDGSGTFKIGERKSKVPKGIKGVPTFVAPGKRSARLGSIDWGVACLILPWRMYLHTGDVQSFEPHYEHVKDFISFYRTYKNENGVIDNGLGDWCPPRWDRRKAPEFMECHPFVSGTAFYYQALKIASEMADVLGDRKFSRQCRKEAKEIKAAFNDVYLKEIENSDLKHYGSQTATVMALNLGMVESADVASRVEALVHDIIHRHDGHHSCGIHGQRHLYSVLADHGQDELAYQMLTDMTFPSPGYVLSCGLSTWPERRFEWKNVRLSNSFNHPMNGAFAAFMHESLGGIRPDESKPGYQHFVLKPHLTGQLDWTKAQFESPYGLIRSDWKNDADSFVWEIEIPPNATATVFVPCSADQELTEKLSANQAITVNENQLTWRQLDVGSGVYRFVVK
jgi:alpha-L-rhamnosidase